MSEYKRRPEDQGFGKAVKFMPMAIALVGISVAWGALSTKNQSQGVQIETNKQKIEQLLTGQARIDERTKRTGEDVKEIKQLLRDVLKEKRK